MKPDKKALQHLLFELLAKSPEWQLVNGHYMRRPWRIAPPPGAKKVKPTWTDPPWKRIGDGSESGLQVRFGKAPE